MNACNSCSDFWGADADISVKDAWYKWGKDKESKNIVVIRNKMFEHIFCLIHNIKVFELSKEDLLLCQKDTIRYKQKAAAVRAVKDITNWNNIDIEHRIHHYISELSKKEYRKMMEIGYNNKIIRWIELIDILRRFSPIYIIKKIFLKVMS